jgi:hypothetical protein
MTTETYLKIMLEMQVISEAHLRIVDHCEALPKEEVEQLARTFIPLVRLGDQANSLVSEVYHKSNPEINDLITKALNNEQTGSSTDDPLSGGQH